MTVIALDPERRGNRHSGTAYEQIKEQIIRCQLALGARVTEAHLAAALGMGKAPVREALQRLHNDGLVQVIPRHDYQAAPITLRDVHDIFALRLILESASARLAAGHVDAAQLRRLDQLYQASYTPGDRESEATFLRANTELHATVARATGNRQLADIMVTMLSRMDTDLPPWPRYAQSHRRDGARTSRPRRGACGWRRRGGPPYHGGADPRVPAHGDGRLAVHPRPALGQRHAGARGARRHPRCA